MKHGEQVRLFRTIPGLEKAEFARLGGLHRNTFLNSPLLLDETLRLKARAAYPLRRADHRLRGLCGIGGGRASWRRGSQRPRCSAQRQSLPPLTTAHGALLAHITGRLAVPGEGPRDFQPMNINFGLFPPIDQPVRRRGWQAPARHCEDARAEARPLPPRAARLRCMARRGAPRRGLIGGAPIPASRGRSSRDR